LQAIRKLQACCRLVGDLFVDRAVVVRLLALATVCREHLLLLGPPGTAKTRLLQEFANLLGLRQFSFLLTRFTEPAELFGPLDVAAFNQGTYRVRTAGMLPETELALLDEVFQGSAAILNTLLAVVNERTFHNGAEPQRVPLVSLVGASNALPDDPALLAFADRLLLRHQVEPVALDHLDALLQRGWELEEESIRASVQSAGSAPVARRAARLTPAEMLNLHACLRSVDRTAVLGPYTDLVRTLRAEGIVLSDRRTVKGLKLVLGAALLREATAATAEDLWPVEYLWPTPEESVAIRGIVARAGGRAPQAARAASVETIVAEQKRLESQEAALQRDTVHAHLVQLNERRLLLRQLEHSPDATVRARATEARRLCEESIGRVMSIYEKLSR
jgi:MoxR-like ATPase